MSYNQRKRRKVKKRSRKAVHTNSGITLHRIGNGLIHIHRNRRRVHKLRRGRTS
jgi:hypothetical protein